MAKRSVSRRGRRRPSRRRRRPDAAGVAPGQTLVAVRRGAGASARRRSTSPHDALRRLAARRQRRRPQQGADGVAARGGGRGRASPTSRRTCRAAISSSPRRPKESERGRASASPRCIHAEPGARGRGHGAQPGRARRRSSNRNPMPEHVNDPAKLHVSFLTGKPTPPRRSRRCDAEEFDPERFVVDGRGIYLWFPNGAGRSKLATLPWRKRIGVAGYGTQLADRARRCSTSSTPDKVFPWPTPSS